MRTAFVQQVPKGVEQGLGVGDEQAGKTVEGGSMQIGPSSSEECSMKSLVKGSRTSEGPGKSYARVGVNREKLSILSIKAD